MLRHIGRIIKASSYSFCEKEMGGNFYTKELLGEGMLVSKLDCHIFGTIYPRISLMGCMPNVQRRICRKTNYFTTYLVLLYGDRIFEKRGKGRDGTGECGKTRYFQGIERSLGRDRGGGVSFILRLGRRILRPSFFMPSGAKKGAHRRLLGGRAVSPKRAKTPGKPRKTGIPGG